MSQHRAISQLLSLGQESFEDEIWRLVSIKIYIFSSILTLFPSNFFKINLNLKYFTLGY